MFPFNLLFLVLSRGGETEKQPWEKGNSFRIDVGIDDINFLVTKVNYTNAFGAENISAGITDITFVVTKV